MKQNDPAISDEDLNAYIDGELIERRQEEVESWLAAHPDAFERLAAYRVNDAALKRALHGAPRTALMRQVARQRRGPVVGPFLRRAAAVVLCVGLGYGIAAVYPWRSSGQAQTFPAQALAAHQVYGPSFAAQTSLSSDRQRSLNEFLARGLGTSFAAPDLSASGFTLVDGRLLPNRPYPAAQLIYRDVQGRLLTLFLKVDPEDDTIPPPEAGKRFTWIKEQDVRLCLWKSGAQRLALAGDFEQADMMKIAKLVKN
jgi:anti-sigma factor RsiW